MDAWLSSQMKKSDRNVIILLTIKSLTYQEYQVIQANNIYQYRKAYFGSGYLTF